MPERFLLQILRSLVTHGILKSTRGVDGGYVLLRDAHEVSLLDVIEAIEGPLTHEVAIGEGLPPSSQEKLANVLDEVTQSTLDKLGSVMLADLICSPEEMARLQQAKAAAEQAKQAEQARQAEQAIAPTPQPHIAPTMPANAPSNAPGSIPTGVTTRIDAPSSVPQTPIASPAFKPNPPAGPGMTVPSPAPAPSPTNATSNVLGTTNPLPNINPNSGTSL